MQVADDVINAESVYKLFWEPSQQVALDVYFVISFFFKGCATPEF